MICSSSPTHLLSLNHPLVSGAFSWHTWLVQQVLNWLSNLQSFSSILILPCHQVSHFVWNCVQHHPYTPTCIRILTYLISQFFSHIKAKFLHLSQNLLPTCVSSWIFLLLLYKILIHNMFCNSFLSIFGQGNSSPLYQECQVIFLSWETLTLPFCEV